MQLLRCAILLLLLVGVLTAPLAQAVLPPVTNFAKVTVSGGYDSVATSITLLSGHGAKLPSTFPFPLVWWNCTDYGAPEDDPFVEIMSATAKSTDMLTSVRAQEGTAASNHNTGGKTYCMVLTLTKGMWDQIRTDIAAAAGGSSRVLTGTGSPEGVVAADPGTIYLRDDVFSGINAIYQKIDGTGNTGWKNTPDLSIPGPIGGTSPSTAVFTDVVAESLYSEVLTLKGGIATYGTTVAIDAAAQTTHVITATNSTGFLIENPTNPVLGRLLFVQVKNSSGGVLGTITWDTLYKMATFIRPATGFTRTVGFLYNGTNWTEIFCSPEVQN